MEHQHVKHSPTMHVAYLSTYNVKKTNKQECSFLKIVYAAVKYHIGSLPHYLRVIHNGLMNKAAAM